MKVAIPELKKLNADIHLKAIGNLAIEDFNGFYIKVTNITKSPLKRFLRLYDGRSVLKSSVFIADEIYQSKPLSALLIERAKDMVAKLH